MSDTEPTWSPADNPYAIAVSESQWWLRCALLTSQRMRDDDDPRSSGFSSRQIDARQLVVALWQLLMAEKLQQAALRALGIDRAVYAELSRARQRFEKALPGIKHMRDALMHFDEWARGVGNGPQKKDVEAGKALRDVASAYWGFDYAPEKDTITLGPYVIEVEAAIRAATALADDIYQAARAVDQRRTVELRAQVVDALAAAGVSCGSAGDVLKVSLGLDTRIWLSLDVMAAEQDHRPLSEQVVAALAVASLQLLSSAEPQSSNPAKRLLTGEALYVTPVNAQK
ncbi:hypothetical protein BC739_004926 [Kutzneria viridogrisea]|uniref:Uncharacterized protein n=1 Tax=Kutzneria viridogrisea TaxID=47990 RepID=A0ABR6BLZ5_9PSEU|nr:hypothetical protein [Kutzneria viridogrisea]